MLLCANKQGRKRKVEWCSQLVKNKWEFCFLYCDNIGTVDNIERTDCYKKLNYVLYVSMW